MDEVAAAASVEVELVDAKAVHLLVALVDEALAFAAQRAEIGCGQGTLQDEEALLTELARLLRCDAQCRDGHANPSVVADYHIICGGCSLSLRGCPRLLIVYCDDRRPRSSDWPRWTRGAAQGR